MTQSSQLFGTRLLNGASRLAIALALLPGCSNKSSFSTLLPSDLAIQNAGDPNGLGGGGVIPPGGNGTPNGGNGNPFTGPGGNPYGGGNPNPPGSPEEFAANTNCTIGYPYQSANQATNLPFNESDILAYFSPKGNVSVSPGSALTVWYSDEHAMTLGIRQVVVIDANGGTTTTDYALSPLNGNPGNQSNPAVGSTDLTGDHAGTDTSSCSADGSADKCSRPMWPALYITDISSNANNTAGDWQFGGVPIPPHALYGTWKGAVKTVDKTTSPPTIKVVADKDPAKNYWNLGAGIAAPTGSNEGFGTAISWDFSKLGLKSTHNYRLQFMVHDGDQYYSGGDVGQNCLNVQVP